MMLTDRAVENPNVLNPYSTHNPAFQHNVEDVELGCDMGTPSKHFQCEFLN